MIFRPRDKKKKRSKVPTKQGMGMTVFTRQCRIVCRREMGFACFLGLTCQTCRVEEKMSFRPYMYVELAENSKK